MISLIDFFQSIFVGISIAAIPGPIFFELIRRLLAKGFRSGALLLAGDFVGNFLLMSLIFFGVSHFLTQAPVMAILNLCGSLILFYLAFLALKLSSKDINQSYDKQSNGKNNSFWVGFLIATLNPLVVALWIPLTGYYLSKLNSIFDAFPNVFLISLGFMIFFFPLAIIINFTKKIIPVKLVVMFSKLCGLVLLYFGLSLMYQLITSLLK